MVQKNLRSPFLFSNIVDSLIKRSIDQADYLAYKFITEKNTNLITYKELDTKARSIAAWLQKHEAQEKRAMLCLQPGLDYIAAFLGCLYAGVIAVPAYPPRNNRYMERLQSIINDANAQFILTSKDIANQHVFVEKILIIEELNNNLSKEWKPISISLDDLAFLQYTSGSTGEPKGVIVTHGNIIKNIEMISTVSLVQTDYKIMCSWLPPYHDMGLIGGILFPLYEGFPAVLIPPTSFFQKPIKWLKVISEEKATISLAPNFAYDLCVQAVQQEKQLKLDLSSWKIAFNGAEPVSNRTIEEFNKTFTSYGFDIVGMCPCYGMAEATLMLTSDSPLTKVTVKNVDKYSFEQGDIIFNKEYDFIKNIQIVSCGYGYSSDATHQIIIVNPLTNKLLTANKVGEVWASGPTITKGYWNKSELTNEIFGAYLSEGNKGPYFRTGDLGFLDENNQLFITGRLKDLIIFQGRNIYPQDIEATVFLSHPDLIVNGCIAFSIYIENKEQLIIIQEVKRHIKEYNIIFESIIQRVLENHEIVPFRIVLIRQASIPKTSSGKLQRSYCHQLLLENKLTIVANWEQGISINEDNKTAPRNDIEKQLVEICSQLLGLDADKVGIRDDFFKLGGDSIVGIQLVNRLRQKLGLNVSIKDIFSYKTIEQLYDNVLSKEQYTNIAPDIKTEQGILTGEIPLLPIQEWFFDCNFAKNYDRNQSFIIKTPNLDFNRLQVSINKLVEHHDSFRLRYKKVKDVNTSYLQYYDNNLKPEELKTLDIRTLKAKENSKKFEDKIQEVLTNWQSGFHLEHGPTYSIGYIYGYADGSSRIYFVLHYLIVDTISCRILAEDLKNIYNNKDLGFKGSSYRQWISALREYVNTNENEKIYWRKILSDYDNSNNPINNLVTSDYTNNYISLQLNQEQTQQLLQESTRAYNTQVNDILLTALGYALYNVTNSKVIHIVLEDSGREEINSSINITRTLGCFTTMYPVRLEIKEEVSSSLKSIKDSLRQVPHNGIGYGLLIGYQTNTLPKVSFHYLGQFYKDDETQDLQAQSNPTIQNFWNIINNSGVSIYNANQDCNLLNINSLVIEGNLQFNIVSKLDKKTTIKVTELLKQHLEKIINHTVEQTRNYLTASDIDNIISQQYLDKLQESREIEGVYLANSLQQGLIYHALNQGDVDDAYRMQLIWQYNNQLEIDKLKKAWQYAQKRYSILRLRLAWKEELVQVIDKEGVLDWRYIDLSEEPNDRIQNSKIVQIQWKDMIEAYSLEHGNLFRVYLIKQRNDLFTCIFSNHQAILDGWSYSILLGYIHDTYLKLQDNDRILLSVDKSYQDAQKYLQKYQDYNIDYWNKYVSQIEKRSDLNGLLSSSSKHKHLRVSEYKHIIDLEYQHCIIDGSLYHNLKKLSQKEGITLNAIIQYAWHKVLNIYSNSNQTVVGTIVSGRNLPIENIENSVGLYMNTLPLIVEHKNQITKSIIESIKDIQNDINELNSRSISLVKLQKGGERLFDSIFTYQNYPTPISEEHLSKLKININIKEAIGKTDYPLELTVYEKKNSIIIELDYAGKLFAEDNIKHLLLTMKMLLEQIVMNPSQKIQSLSYISEKQYKQIVYNWNETDTDYLGNKTVPSLFEEQVNRNPDNIALIHEDRKFTYKELNDKANRLANYLKHTYYIMPELLVGLCLDKNEHMLIAILSVLKVGGVCVPIDPDDSDDKIQYILHDTKTKIVLTNQVYKERLKCINKNNLIYSKNTVKGQQIDILAIDSKTLQKQLLLQLSTNLDTKIVNTNLAYIAYTAGTTHNPNGVMIEHQRIVNYISNVKLYISILSEDKAYYLTNIGFGSTTLCNLCLGSEHNNRKVNFDFIIYDEHNPTETTIVISNNQTYLDNNLTIEKLYNNYKYYVLDSNLRPLPIGAIGELYIGGVGLARGYLNRPELTAERFIANPFQTKEEKILNKNVKLYKSRNLVRWLSNGNLEYIKCNDFQIKIKDYKIQLEEIARALSSYKRIKQSVVLAQEYTNIHGNSNSKHLVGYYVSDSDFCEEEILRYLQTKLPGYMVPSFFVHLKKLPLTINGKLDKKLFPEPEFIDSKSDVVAPQNELESRVRQIWAEILGLCEEEVSIYDNFFRLGGNSILAIKLVNKLNKYYKSNVKICDIFLYKNIKLLLPIIIQTQSS